MRPRLISSIPDGALQTATACSFRSDLDSTLQPMNCSSRTRLSRRRREVSSRVRTKPNQLRVWAGARRRRTGLSRIRAAFQTAHWAYPYVSCMRPPTTQNLLGYPMIPPPQFPVFSSRCLFHSTLQTDSLRHAERRINSLQSITPVQFDKMFILSNWLIGERHSK